MGEALAVQTVREDSSSKPEKAPRLRGGEFGPSELVLCFCKARPGVR